MAIDCFAQTPGRAIECLVPSHRTQLVPLANQRLCKPGVSSRPGLGSHRSHPLPKKLVEQGKSHCTRMSFGLKPTRRPQCRLPSRDPFVPPGFGRSIEECELVDVMAMPEKHVSFVASRLRRRAGFRLPRLKKVKSPRREECKRRGQNAFCRSSMAAFGLLSLSRGITIRWFSCSVRWRGNWGLERSP